MLITFGLHVSRGEAYAQGDKAAVIEKGRQVAVAADCSACHTSGIDGQPYAGGYSIMSPIGAIFSTNITPSKTAGIGDYSEQQFARAVREGVRSDGAHLYPAMPYTAYVGMTDEDLHALYMYFMEEVKPVDDVGRRTALPFPFNIRLSMMFWNLLFLDKNRFKPDPAQSREWNRGKYLADVLAHCGTCHTPRNALMAEDSRRTYGGASLGNWFAPNITSDPVSGIGAWSDDELVQYLATGRVHGKAQAGGGMAEAVTMSLQYLPADDLKAIVTYLRSVPPQEDEAQEKPGFEFGAPAPFEEHLRGASPSDSPSHPQSGEALYSAYCASCHQVNGAGTPDQRYPSLFHNTATGRNNPDNLVTAILVGVQREIGGKQVFMPRFDEESYVQSLSDEQVATISNYVLQQFGNPAIAVSAERVAQLRAGGTPSPLVALARFSVPACVVVGLLALVAIGIWQIRRRQRLRSAA